MTMIFNINEEYGKKNTSKYERASERLRGPEREREQMNRNVFLVESSHRRWIYENLRFQINKVLTALSSLQ